MAGQGITNDYARNVTINSGVGNDYIHLGRVYATNNVIQYKSGDGNDIIIGLNADDTLHITKGRYSTLKSGHDFIVKVGKNKIVIKLDGSNEKINIKNSSGQVSTYYDDWKVWTGSIEYNKKSNVTLAGSKKGDTISNNLGENVLITGKSGNDSIFNGFGSNVTIFGGTGNDTIENYGGNSATITGGKGKDLISLGSYAYNDVVQYASGDGNDTIFGFNSDDILYITKGSYKTSVSGNDVIVKIGSSSVTLKYAASKEISIKNSKGNVTTKTYGSSTSALLAENNFVTADNLSDIVENNLTPTSLEKIETNNFENLTQENNLITFSEK